MLWWSYTSRIIKHHPPLHKQSFFCALDLLLRLRNTLFEHLVHILWKTSRQITIV
jgi:hypothetical protein